MDKRCDFFYHIGTTIIMSIEKKCYLIPHLIQILLFEKKIVLIQQISQGNQYIFYAKIETFK